MAPNYRDIRFCPRERLKIKSSIKIFIDRHEVSSLTAQGEIISLDVIFVGIVKLHIGFKKCC